MKIKYKKTLKSSDEIEVGDEFKFAGIMVKVEEVTVNGYDQMVFGLHIVGATVKKRSKMRVIVPKRIPITTLT